MKATHCIARFVQHFFTQYLTAQRGLSPNTILSYRDTLKLLLQFVAGETAKPPDKLTLEDFDANLVLAFLDHLEQTRGNCSQTRNNRLAGLRTFFRYVAGQEPTVMERCKRICDIPLKRTEHTIIEYLEDEEVRALLESVDPNSRNGLRDYALLLFLYNTGARVQEAVDLELTDLRLQPPFQVKLTGKGRKERVCPLWPETVSALETYFRHRDAQASSVPAVFVNARGEPITRFGIRYLVCQYAAKAEKTCPSLKSKNVTPHSLRHTTAMHLLQAGNDITVVKDWLGHADVNTTHGYVEIDLDMKRKALQACQAPDVKTSRRGPRWQAPKILQWLEELSRAANDYVKSSPGFPFPSSELSTP